MHRLLIAALRAGVAAAILIGLFGQIVVVPATASDEVDRFPPYEPFAVPYATVAILGVACVQVVLGAVWVLLGMVERDAVFTRRALRPVDTVIGAALVATLLAFGVAVHLAVAEIPSPADGMELIGALGAAVTCVGVGAAFTLLVVVMRGLLRKATRLRTEMAGVV
ncbi:MULTISPECIES: DUF2975 domain-containing protein [Streptomyces]|uniref:DUF2975 domain-containing protein n=1 Tax=Streptomyces lienomycini TaxID=284035 RepID=A0ABV9X4A0_9ACTN|nr:MULTISPECIES: DUF2975 domain-containing protein [Streptomyces]